MLESSNVVGGFSQGSQFTVLQYQSGGGGWYRVQGQTLGGWVVADPTLTAEGTYNTYAQAGGVTALYPQDWGFQNESFGTLFVPQQGSGQSIVLESANSLASFGAPGLPGYTQSSSSSTTVCGYTGTLSYYTKNAVASSATPPPLPVAPAAAVRGNPVQDRFHARDAARLQLSEQRPARCVRCALQLHRVPVPPLRGTGCDADTEALENRRPRALVDAGDGIAVHDRRVRNRHSRSGDEKNADVRGTETETP